MLVQSFLVQGATAVVVSRLSSIPAADVLVLFSLGLDNAALAKAVYLTDTYGILGFDEAIGRNIELMEKDRGSEYGCVGGSGGEGCLVAGFSDGAVAGHSDIPPENARSCMIVADQSKTWAKVQSKSTVQYGGITKECWKVTEDGGLAKVPYFWVADTSSTPTGISTFTEEDAKSPVQSLLKDIPAGLKPSSVGLFPCFTRGVNLYGAEHVEPTAISSILPQARIYGMFAHGELGPDSFSGYVSSPNQIACKQHSMTSILTIHTEKTDA